MRVIIDRLESDYAVIELEDGSFATMPVKLLSGAKEGDVIRIEVDQEATEERKQLIRDLQQKLKQKNDPLKYKE